MDVQNTTERCTKCYKGLSKGYKRAYGIDMIADVASFLVLRCPKNACNIDTHMGYCHLGSSLHANVTKEVSQLNI